MNGNYTMSNWNIFTINQINSAYILFILLGTSFLIYLSKTTRIFNGLCTALKHGFSNKNQERIDPSRSIIWINPKTRSAPNIWEITLTFLNNAIWAAKSYLSAVITHNIF